MKVCTIVGCTAAVGCEVCPVHHKLTLKLHEYGFTYYAASYWHRFCEPSGVYVSLIPGKAEDAAEKAMEWEANELPSYCEDEECQGDCSFCAPDLCTGGEFTYRVKDLFSARELMEHRRALLKGEVVYLDR